MVYFIRKQELYEPATTKKSSTWIYILGGCAIFGIILVVLGIFLFESKIKTFFHNPSETVAKIITAKNSDVDRGSNYN